jgi:hypothetical protein
MQHKSYRRVDSQEIAAVAAPISLRIPSNSQQAKPMNRD